MYGVFQPVSGAAHSPGQEVEEIAGWVARSRQMLSALRPPQQDDFMVRTLPSTNEVLVLKWSRNNVYLALALGDLWMTCDIF